MSRSLTRAPLTRAPLRARPTPTQDSLHVYADQPLFACALLCALSHLLLARSTHSVHGMGAYRHCRPRRCLCHDHHHLRLKNQDPSPTRVLKRRGWQLPGLKPGISSLIASPRLSTSLEQPLPASTPQRLQAERARVSVARMYRRLRDCAWISQVCMHLL